MRAGLELCFYLMPGLGGRAAAAAHVAGSARVIGAVAAAAPPERPLVVRLRTAAVPPGTPLAEREASGDFVLPDDVEVAQELRDLLEQLGDARVELRSDHTLNLMRELEGSLPRGPRAPARHAGRVPRPAARGAGALRHRRAARDPPHARRPAGPGRGAALERQFDGYAQPSADELLDVAASLRSRYI